MTRGAQNSKGLRKYCILRSVERKNTRPLPNYTFWSSTLYMHPQVSNAVFEIIPRPIFAQKDAFKIA